MQNVSVLTKIVAEEIDAKRVVEEIDAEKVVEVGQIDAALCCPSFELSELVETFLKNKRLLNHG